MASRCQYIYESTTGEGFFGFFHIASGNSSMGLDFFFVRVFKINLFFIAHVHDLCRDRN